MGCKCESLNGLYIDGYIAWIQKLVVKHFTLEVHTCFPIVAGNCDDYNKTVLFLISQAKTLLEYSGFFFKINFRSIELVGK